MCLCYKSVEATACLHWQGPDRMPLSELGGAAPGTTLSASAERLPTVRATLLHARCRKRAIPTLAEPPRLGSALDRHWRLSSVQKGENYHKVQYAFLRDYDLMVSAWGKNYVFVHRRLRKPALCVICSTSGVNRALYSNFIIKAGNTKSHYNVCLWAGDGPIILSLSHSNLNLLQWHDYKALNVNVIRATVQYKCSGYTRGKCTVARNTAPAHKTWNNTGFHF